MSRQWELLDVEVICSVPMSNRGKNDSLFEKGKFCDMTGKMKENRLSREKK